MAHHQSTAELIFGGVMLGGLLLASWIATVSAHDRLNDPTDERTVWLDEILAIAKLDGPGLYRITVYRQSGNVHATHEVRGIASDAIQSCLSTFRRAKIEAVNVLGNDAGQLSFGRMYHDHRGRAEGKKVGRATIQLIERASPPQIGIRFSITAICDCGEATKVPLDQAADPFTCGRCGKVDQFSEEQLATIEQAAEKGRRQAEQQLAEGDLTRISMPLTEIGNP